MPQGNPQNGELYKHFKNKMYQIISIATHSETREKMVIYQALYDDFQVYARPFDMFVSPVDHEKYPYVSQEYRFELINREALAPTRETSDSVSAYKVEPKQTPTQTVAENTSVQIEQQPVAEKETVQEENSELAGVSAVLLAFLDEDDWNKKYQIIADAREEITDPLIDNLAAAMDVVIDEGNTDDRYQQLKTCIRTRKRFETNRFR